MTVWFTSDLHFGHPRIIELARRPFPDRDLGAMTAAIIAAWETAGIGAGDDVHILGDFALGNAEWTRDNLTAIWRALPGRKHLVRGNHDSKAVLRLPWESVHDLRTVKAEGHRFVLCHYPLTTWPEAHHGAFHLHGHSHGMLTDRRPRRTDVGIDVSHGLSWGTPLSAADLIERLGSADYEAVDHHGL